MTTNFYNLPEPLAKALSPERRQPVMGRFAATALIDAPLRRILLMRYFDEIQEDVSDSFWAFFGKMGHSVIQQHGSVETSEKKLEYTHHTGSTLVTVGDYYFGTELVDWKFTSVWSLILGNKEDWHRQLEVERFIYEMKGLPVSKLSVWACLRDWQKSKSYDHGYPKIPFVEKEYKMWEHEALLVYVNQRVALHMEAEMHLNDPESIAPCSSEERWERPSKWAMMKIGQKKAVKLFDTPEAAEMESRTKSELYVEHRPGVNARCQDYCAVMPFCPYKEKFVKGKEIGNE